MLHGRKNIFTLAGNKTKSIAKPVLTHAMEISINVLTLRNSKECKLARHGNIISGKLTATDKTKPIFITSLVIDGEKLSITLPVSQ